MTAAYYFGIAHGALATLLFMSLWWAFGVLYPVLRASSGWELLRWDIWNLRTNWRLQDAPARYGVVLLIGFALGAVMLLVPRALA